MTMQASEDRQDLVDQAYHQIQTLLYHRGLANAETYSDVALAESLSISRTPIRAALTRLECEGMLRRVPGKGWATIPLTVKDLDEIFYLKESLECRVAHDAAECITPESTQALLAAIGEMEKAAETEDLEAWMPADYRFHQILFSIVGNQRLQRFITELDNQWYHFLVALALADGRIAAMCDEHRQIATAVVARDPDLAAEKMRQALRCRRASVEKVLTRVQALRRSQNARVSA